MADKIKTVGPQDVFNRLAGGEHCPLVDVRERFEFEEARLDGSILIPLSSLHKEWHLIEQEKPVYLLCRSGKRAEIAALELARHGFTNLMVVDGGLEAWIAAGYPLRSPGHGSGFGQVGQLFMLLVLSLGLIVFSLNSGDPAWSLLSVAALVTLMCVAFSIRPRTLATAGSSLSARTAHNRD